MSEKGKAMKMPELITEDMVAPCGMHCTVCYKHCNVKKPCAGCKKGDEGKPGHCRSCTIKECIEQKSIRHCCFCQDFPCKLIKNLDRSYRKRYHSSLVQNGNRIKEIGVHGFLKEDKEKFTCPSCGGVISIHEGICSQCEKKINFWQREGTRKETPNA